MVDDGTLADRRGSLTIDDEGIHVSGQVPAGYLYVDGIVGDVGQGVLRDRRVLAEEGVVVLSRAQLSMLLEGIDWRMPQRTWRPELAG